MSLGMGRRRCRRVGLFAAALAGAACCAMVFAAMRADAVTFTAHTNRGGHCRIHTHASRTGTVISYGVRVNRCATKFGVRYAVSQGALYDQKEEVPVDNGYMKRRQGSVPYSNQRNVPGTTPSHGYRTKIDVTVVLKTRRDRSTPHPERWRDPGGNCRVKTTWHNGDTLGCTLANSVPAGA